MANTPKLVIPELSAAQAQKEVTVNTGVIRTVDALVQSTVKDKDLSTPPGSPVDGDSYIVGGTATGVWAGHENKIAYYRSSSWVFHAPAEGWLTYVQDENLFYSYNGSAWVDLATGGGLGFTSLTDTPADYTDDGEKLVRVNTAANGLEFVEANYDVGFFYPNKPSASEVILRIPFVRDVDFPANLSGSQAKAGTAATAETIFSIKKNGVEAFTATVAAAGTTATFSGSAISFAAGDILTVVAPGSQDATLESIGFTLKGVRG